MTPAPQGQRAEAGMRIRAEVDGCVQGVGFRPYVYRLAVELGLAGYVTNTPAGVTVEAEGPKTDVQAFLDRLPREKPPLAEIRSLDWREIPPQSSPGFVIEKSAAGPDPVARILPDMATCPDCLREILDPGDRRYQYPFTNCTHCGPRYTIIHGLPYDRPRTSMAGFPMCPQCRREYEDPMDRRFHAQPVACPACGPHVQLWDGEGRCLSAETAALDETAERIRQGAIAAVKGLGGFHLVCDARDTAALERLRERKAREEKPFAVMAPRWEEFASACRIDAVAVSALESPQAPIVLVPRIPGADDGLSRLVAPDSPALGLMAPYTPLHHLLLARLGFPVVATSGNLRDEPICIDENEALRRLTGIADVFLVHNRPIVRPVDDSVVRIIGETPVLLRRARGYAPAPISIEHGSEHSVVAMGGHLKNTAALTMGHRIMLSQHIGDLETPEARDAAGAAIASLRGLYRITPDVAACDMHPDYASTRSAHDSGLPVYPVQHHHAHIVACMAEHGLEGPVLGVSWDGTGYGDDGTVWGGEFLTATETAYQRVAALRPFPLPGGEQAMREPRRSALGLLYALDGGRQPLDKTAAPLGQGVFRERELKVLDAWLRRHGDSVLTTSAGRLFDAAASLSGLRQYAGYEGQAAMALEAEAATETAEPPLYPMRLRTEHRPAWLDWEPLIKGLLAEQNSGAVRPTLCRAFHRSLADGVRQVAEWAGFETVCLGGGCFQNALLTEFIVELLTRQGFAVYYPQRIPPNDGGLALGQACCVLRRLSVTSTAQKEGSCALPFQVKS
ncbi:MAG: carbamoyltransferase HypF [Candidatus Hydrogenedentota bacterium]